MPLSAQLAWKKRPFKSLSQHLKSFVFYKRNQCGDSGLMGRDTVSLGVWYQTFRRNVMLSSSGESFIFGNYPATGRHIPEDLNFQLLYENWNLRENKFSYCKGGLFALVWCVKDSWQTNSKSDTSQVAATHCAIRFRAIHPVVYEWTLTLVL